MKGGKKTKQAIEKFTNNDPNKDIDIIFNFFQKLTNGELRPKDDVKIGFGVYYS